jgi:hypothetical protein
MLYNQSKRPPLCLNHLEPLLIPLILLLNLYTFYYFGFHILLSHLY